MLSRSSAWTDAAHAYHNSYAALSSSWTCDSLLGAPSRADVCGDEPGAWAPALNGTLAEWVRLEFFDAPVYAQKLEVWEVNAAPFITRVVWEAEDGAMRLGWEGDDATACPGVFVLDDDTRARSPPFRVAAVWVHTSAPGWEAAWSAWAREAAGWARRGSKTRSFAVCVASVSLQVSKQAGLRCCVGTARH